MTPRQPPRLAVWMLKRFGSGPDNAALLGDLAEQYAEKNSAWWYWRQTLGGIVVTTFKDIRNHKLLTLRALIVGWFVFWFLWSKLVQYGVPFIEPATRAVVEALYRSLFAVRSLFAGGVAGPADYFEFMSFVRSVGHVENVVWFFYAAFPILGSCIVGILSGWIVGRLHRRKISIVLAHGTAVLVNWIVLGLATHPVVYPPLSWFVPVLTLGIVLGGVLCASRRDLTFQQGGLLQEN